MIRPRPGWLVVLAAAVLAVSVWLPWLTTAADGGGRVSAIGGAHGSLQLGERFSSGQLIVLLTSTLLVTGAMVGRGISARAAGAAALAISVVIAVLTARYYRMHVGGAVVAGYGWYVAAVAAVAAVGCSLWALIAALGAGRTAATGVRGSRS